MNDACIGSVSEVFDAEEPYTPRGCVAQAWRFDWMLMVALWQLMTYFFAIAYIRSVSLIISH